MVHERKAEALKRWADGEGDESIGSDLGVSRHTIRRWASESGVAKGSETTEPIRSPITRRCMNKHCIRRFVPVNAEHWYHEAACRAATDTWTREEILEEEGDLIPGASTMELAKRAFAQKNQLQRRVNTLRSHREYMQFLVQESLEEYPGGRYEPMPVPPFDGRGRSPREVILVCSDWQIGKLNKDIGVGVMLDERLPRIKEATHQIIQHLRAAKHPVNRVHIVFAGDMLEGCWIYGGQNVSGLDRTGNTHRITKQIPLVATMEAELALDIASYTPEVIVHSVPGNHGRPNGKSDYADPEDNFDSMIAHWAKDKAANQKNIGWNIAEHWWGTFWSLGRQVVAIHGDQWRGEFSRLEKLLPNWVLANEFGGVPDLFITAHRHSFHTTFINGVPVLQNGTIDGGSDYFFKQTGVMSKPEQTVVVMSEARGVEYIAPIYFP